MGIVPIWGFQMLTALGLSIYFRLNKVLVILAANISIPPMIPLVIFASHWIGGLWMGAKAQPMSFSSEITYAMIKDSFFQYVIGAITLAILAGAIFGVLTYGLLKLRKQLKHHESQPPGT